MPLLYVDRFPEIASKQEVGNLILEELTPQDITFDVIEHNMKAANTTAAVILNLGNLYLLLRLFDKLENFKRDPLYKRHRGALRSLVKQIVEPINGVETTLVEAHHIIIDAVLWLETHSRLLYPNHSEAFLKLLNQLGVYPREDIIAKYDTRTAQLVACHIQKYNPSEISIPALAKIADLINSQTMPAIRLLLQHAIEKNQVLTLAKVEDIVTNQRINLFLVYYPDLFYTMDGDMNADRQIVTAIKNDILQGLVRAIDCVTDESSKRVEAYKAIHDHLLKHTQLNLTTLSIYIRIAKMITGYKPNLFQRFIPTSAKTLKIFSESVHTAVSLLESDGLLTTAPYMYSEHGFPEPLTFKRFIKNPQGILNELNASGEHKQRLGIANVGSR